MTPEERAMEKVVKALGESTPPVGLEGRILTRLAERRTMEPSAWFGRGTVRVGVVAVALAVIVAAAFVMHRGQQSSRNFATREIVEPVAPKHKKVLAKSESSSAGQPEEIRVPVMRVAPKQVRIGERSQPTATRRDVEFHYRRTSFPAPPAPLTEQERLLVAIVRSGRITDFAMLKAKQGAAADAAE